MFDAAAAAKMRHHCATAFAGSGGSFPVLPKHFEFPPQTRRAAVFVPLTNYCGEPAVIFTLRSAHLSTHKGQVSFPGGHVDAGETSEQAALRETTEELGILHTHMEMVASGQTVPAITGTAVTPVVGWVRQEYDTHSTFTVSEKEVDRVFFRTIHELLTDRSVETLSRDGITMDIPFFHRADYPKEERIWGLTAMVLAAVLDHIVVPTFGLPPKSPPPPPGF
jgi:8-oxo-dGTP pyrophosphatase MutT (NUDIX family)